MKTGCTTQTSSYVEMNCNLILTLITMHYHCNSQVLLLRKLANKANSREPTLARGEHANYKTW